MDYFWPKIYGMRANSEFINIIRTDVMEVVISTNNEIYLLPQYHAVNNSNFEIIYMN
jgi:hypothetical protein